MKISFTYNQNKVKDSVDQYRNINGKHYTCWTSNNTRFKAIIEKAKKNKIRKDGVK